MWGGGFNNQIGPIMVHIYPLFNNNLHVKYRGNLIRTFLVKIKNKINFNFIGVMLGGPGRGGGGGASIIRLGPSWSTSTLYLIIIYMSNIEANLIRTFGVKIQNMKKNKINVILFWVMLGPYIKSRGAKMSANADLITMETYVPQGETI